MLVSVYCPRVAYSASVKNEIYCHIIDMLITFTITHAHAVELNL